MSIVRQTKNCCGFSVSRKKCYGLKHQTTLLGIIADPEASLNFYPIHQQMSPIDDTRTAGK